MSLLTGVLLWWPSLWQPLYCRFEDLTNRNDVRLDSKCDRTVSLYGYVRGAPIRTGLSVHIAGQYYK